jgi:hypothetical protein
MMKKALAAAVNRLSSGRTRAYISRVAWLDLDCKIRGIFHEIQSYGLDTSELGNLYIISNLQYEPFNKSPFSALNIINQIQIQVGHRHLDISQLTTKDSESKSEYLTEIGAALWYSQDASGGVMVFMSPYKSRVMRMTEENIILARFDCASAISTSAVQGHFEKFFRYCNFTSVHGALGFSGYLYRLRLRYNDIRFKTAIRASVLKPIIAFITLGLATAGVWATLYSAGKIFHWP